MQHIIHYIMILCATVITNYCDASQLVGQKVYQKQCLYCQETVVRQVSFVHCLTSQEGKCFLCLCLFSTLACLVSLQFCHIWFFILSPLLVCLLSDIPFVSFSSLWFSLLSCIPIVHLA